jgi:hypothetical protein
MKRLTTGAKPVAQAEGAAQRKAFLFDMDVEGVRHLVRRIADQRELGLADCRRGFVPHFVREVGVGGDDVDFGAHFLERGVIVGCIFDFGRAIEGEGCRHEDQHGPFALQRLLGDFDELAVMEGLGLERLDLSIDKGHVVFPLGWVEKWIENCMSTNDRQDRVICIIDLIYKINLFSLSSGRSHSRYRIDYYAALAGLPL